MKAITVMQPWALLLVSGAKRYETRTWRTSHRGLLYIHASRSLTEEMRELCAEEPLRSLLKAQGISRALDLPLGALVGTVELVECIDTDALAATLSAADRALGDFSPGRCAWKMDNPTSLAEPIPYQGNRGLFSVDANSLS